MRPLLSSLVAIAFMLSCLLLIPAPSARAEAAGEASKPQQTDRDESESTDEASPLDPSEPSSESLRGQCVTIDQLKCLADVNQQAFAAFGAVVSQEFDMINAARACSALLAEKVSESQLLTHQFP